MPEDTPAQPEGGSANDSAAAPATPEEKGLTQDEVNKLVGKARMEARASVLKKYGVDTEEELAAKLQKADELEQSQMTEIEKANAEAEKWRQKALEGEAAVNKLQLDALRARIGREKGLPEPLIEKLIGTDEESLVAEIDALLPFIKAASEGEGELGGGTNPAGAAGGGRTPEEKWVAGMANELAAKRRGFFSP